MRGLAVLGAATLVAALSAASTINPAAAAATTKTPAGTKITAQVFGLHDPKQQSTVPNGAIRLWDTNTGWDDLQPAPDQWNFAHLDAMVARAAAKKVKPMLVLGATPAWAVEDPTAPSAPWLQPGTASPPRTEADWITYVSTVAKRYRGRIDAYQIMNEGSLWQFWRGTPERLARLTVLASRAIKLADPAALVVATPMLPRQRTWTDWSTRYLQALKDRRWPVDVFAIHSYQPDSKSNPDGRATGIRRVEKLLTTMGAPKRPLWDTEANYSAASYYAPKVIGEQSTDWVARAYLDSIRLGVARTYWYAYDVPVGHLRITLGQGNLAASGYSAVARWLVGSTYLGCQNSLSPKRVQVTTCTFTRKKHTSWVVWTADRHTRLRLKTATVACHLLTPCVPVTKQTYVTTSPMLLR
ncbi:MAG: endo-1,4-beta-xylanase [Actinomycetes bacterium]